jgi:hypothetical protein
MKEKKYFVIIPADSNAENAKKEQFRYYQRDGETVRVAIGVQQEVPEWVAKRAKEIGDIADYIEL